MNYREESGVYEVTASTLPELFQNARQSVVTALESKKGLRHTFAFVARHGLRTELKKYDRIISALGQLGMDPIYLDKIMIDNLSKPERLDEPAWLGLLQREPQAKFMSSKKGHMFLRKPDPETLEKVRQELEKTPLGRHAIKVMDHNNINVVFGPPIQEKEYEDVQAEYVPDISQLWLSHRGLEEMAESVIHESTHVEQNGRTPEILQFHQMARREYRHKVYGYTATCLMEAQASAREMLYNADKQGLYKSGSEERTKLLDDAFSCGFQDTDEDFRKFLHLVYFGKMLQSNPERLQYERKFIDTEVIFYSDIDFRVCVKTSPYVKTDFLEKFCVDENGECFLPPNPYDRQNSCNQIIRILCDPIMLRRPRMTCMPGTFKP